MRGLLIRAAPLALTALLAAGTGQAAADTGKEASVKEIYGFTMEDIDGKRKPLSDFQGKVLLIVNTASKCGFTPQYEGLQALYEKYKDQGFLVLGFPANNFLNQEPGSNAQIKDFCTTKFSVTFPMFSKISVKGDDIHPLYRYLTSKETNPESAGEIGWNFNKFLVDRHGNVVGRFGARDKPDKKELVQLIERALAAEE